MPEIGETEAKFASDPDRMSGHTQSPPPGKSQEHKVHQANFLTSPSVLPSSVIYPTSPHPH